jgi:uncharacterized protein (TIGR00369 family)
MDPDSAVTRNDLEKILAASSFARWYDLRLDSFSRGVCTLLVPFQKSLERPGGIVAGAVYVTAADCAMWFAIMTLLGKDTMTVTSELNSTFLRPAVEQEVRCTAKVLKPGKTFIFGVAECHDPLNRLLTHHTLTYIRADKPSGK